MVGSAERRAAGQAYGEEYTMRSFVVTCDNRPGEFAKMAEAIAARNINIKTVGGVGYSDRGAVGILTEDEEGTRGALRDVGMTFRECETVDLPLEDRPGRLAEACRRLADSGVNIDFLAPTRLGDGGASVAFGVEDAEAAHKALGE
jgi:hypothetical protein